MKTMSSNALNVKTESEAVAWNAVHTTVSKEGTARSGNRSTTWPFPPFPNPKDKGNRLPKFNPENYEDAPV
jgi:hypothetical protein